MKKLITATCAILISLSAAAAFAFGGCAPGEATVEYTLSEDGSYYIVSGVSGAKNALKKYDVPSTYSADEGEEPKPVKEIGVQAFYECTALASLTIPEGITGIGAYAFSKCSFSKFIIPESVTQIGNGAFWWCSALKEIVIPESVTQIGNSAFRLCSSLERAVINAQISVLYGGMFYNSWQKVGDNTFFSSSLKEIYLPATLQKINSSAFDGNNLVTDIYYAGAKEQWDQLYFYEQVKKDGKEDEFEERAVNKSDVIPSSIKIHYESVYAG